MIAALLSQLSEAGVPSLLTYGPLGIVLAWFMLRAEKGFSKIGDLAHRIDGLTRALLMDMVERESSGRAVKEYATKQIAKIDARNAKVEAQD